MAKSGWDSGRIKKTVTSTLDYDDEHNLNQQQDSTTDTNSTKQSENEIARLNRVVGQRNFFCKLFVDYGMKVKNTKTRVNLTVVPESLITT